MLNHSRTSKTTRRSETRRCEAWLAGWIAGAKCVVLVLQDLIAKREFTTLGQIRSFLATARLSLTENDIDDYREGDIDVSENCHCGQSGA